MFLPKELRNVAAIGERLVVLDGDDGKGSVGKVSAKDQPWSDFKQASGGAGITVC